MLLVMMYTMLRIAGVHPFDYLKPGAKYPQINENPKYSYYMPIVANCKIAKDTSDSFFKNDKYICN